jgi:hypothetical protein
MNQKINQKKLTSGQYKKLRITFLNAQSLSPTPTPQKQNQLITNRQNGKTKAKANTSNYTIMLQNIPVLTLNPSVVTGNGNQIFVGGWVVDPHQID